MYFGGVESGAPVHSVKPCKGGEKRKKGNRNASAIIRGVPSGTSSGNDIRLASPLGPEGTTYQGPQP